MTYPEQGEVNSHHHQSDHPCDESHDTGEDGTNDTGSESEEEGDESETASDWVKDHDIREGVCTVGSSFVEGRAVRTSHDRRRGVPNMGSRTHICGIRAAT